jgi:hypothetical protein
MSRSRRKTPITGHTTAASEKRDKRLANRRLRKRVRQRLAYLDHEDLEDEILPEMRDVSDAEWDFAKDGKMWLGYDNYPKLMRK